MLPPVKFVSGSVFQSVCRVFYNILRFALSIGLLQAQGAYAMK